MLALIFGEDGATLLAHDLDEIGGVLLVGGFGRAGDGQRRRLVDGAQVVGVAPHVVEDARGHVGIVEGGDVGAVENVHPRHHFGAAHPTGEHRLFDAGEDAAHLVGGLGGVGHVLGGEDDHEAVAVGVGDGGLDRFGVARGVGVAQDVNRVVVAPVARQNLVELVRGLIGERGQLPAAFDERVGGEHAGATGVGDDGQARAARARLLGEYFGHGEEVREVFDAQDAAAAEGGVEHVVAACKRAGVRGGGFGRGGGAPGLDDDDGLA